MVKSDDFIAGSAITLGISQMVLSVIDAKDRKVDENTYMYLYMGIFGEYPMVDLSI